MAKITAIPAGNISAMVITVPNAKATPPAKQGTLRFKRWQVLAAMPAGSTVSQYYAAARAAVPGSIASNNPKRAHALGFIVLSAPTTK